MAWVNAQLKKRPAVKPVQDLRQDLRDGVILAYLIEIVGELILDAEVRVWPSLSFVCHSRQVVSFLECLVRGREQI